MCNVHERAQTKSLTSISAFIQVPLVKFNFRTGFRLTSIQFSLYFIWTLQTYMYVSCKDGICQRGSQELQQLQIDQAGKTQQGASVQVCYRNIYLAPALWDLKQGKCFIMEANDQSFIRRYLMIMSLVEKKNNNEVPQDR